MAKYKPIPISAARDIAKKYGKAQVIIVTWDAAHGTEHVTTYGSDKEQCRQAALGGSRVKEALKWPQALTGKPCWCGTVIDPRNLCCRAGHMDQDQDDKMEYG